ncbi:tartrate transporter [Fusarium pseudoanthophilum]|uniref:Tartrate transporter n=1 Tax=Fusarium pseudoanthophilum TaxID=48495 RepID=A0A8H5UN49_9HYPO|nr:tartrate transporter [Fusarium pseudoanthophilum]
MADKKSTNIDDPIIQASDSDYDYGSTQKRAYFTGDTFVSGGATELYKPIPEYEGIHRYDPTAEWTEKEEKKLVRRLDKRICSWVCLMFFALQLDRGNISQALSDGMLDDLGLNTNDYNYGMMIFYLCFLSAEVPSQMISKKLGPDVWIPIQMVTWSIIGICQGFVQDKQSFYATRALLGLIEGGFIPDALLYLSYFYTNKELPMRVGFFYCASNGTFIVAAFLAYGILHMRSVGGWEGWRWLFVLEGTLTFLIGVVSWFYLPPGPTQTASWFRGKDGWFTEREEVIMVNRVLRDDPGKGGMHNRQGLTLKLLWDALMDYDLWPLYMISWTMLVPTNPVTAYLTLNLKALGFGTFETNLLTIPGYVLFLAHLILISWYSEKINNRMVILLYYSFWCFVLLLTLELLPANASPWAWYSATILMIGFPYIHSINVSLTSRNAGSVRTRTVGSAMYNMICQASSVISSQIYRDDDKPLYRRGNKVLLALVGWNVVMTVFIKGYYIWRNKTRERIWSAMSDEERDEYLRTTKDEGNHIDLPILHFYSPQFLNTPISTCNLLTTSTNLKIVIPASNTNMESIWNKFSIDRAAIIEEAFSIATERGQEEWSNADKDVMSQAANDIVRSLGGDVGLTFVEFEVLVAYAARAQPERQLRFLDNLVEVIRASRGIGSLTYYDEQFMEFVMSIHNDLRDIARRNAGLGLSPGPNADIAQHVLYEGQAPVDSMQLPSGETTRTWKSEYEEVSGEGKYTTSVVETVTGDEFSGGAYSTTSTTSSTFTPSRTPMLGNRNASVLESDGSNHRPVNPWDDIFAGATL